jgi:hypothetical protein
VALGVGKTNETEEEDWEEDEGAFLLETCVTDYGDARLYLLGNVSASDWPATTSRRKTVHKLHEQKLQLDSTGHDLNYTSISFFNKT